MRGFTIPEGIRRRVDVLKKRGWRRANRQIATDVSKVLPPRTDVHEFDLGSTVLDIVDAKAQLLMWRSEAEAAINLSWSTEKQMAKIYQAVRRMLQRFPPK